MQRYTGLNAPASVVVFSPDARSILVGIDNSLAVLWNTEVYSTIHRPYRACFLSRCTQSAISDLRANYLWTVYLDKIIVLVCRQLSREITAEERIIYSIADKHPSCPASLTDGNSEPTVGNHSASEWHNGSAANYATATALN